MNTQKRTWLAFSSGKPPSFTVEAWHPASFVWDLFSLHKHLKELKRLKLVLGLRPGAQTGSHPEVLFDQLPLPLLSGDSYVSQTLGPYLEGFAMTTLKTGFVSGGRFMKWGHSLLPVPTSQVMYADATLIPPDRHIAVVNGHFCIAKSLASEHDFFLRCVELKPLSKVNPRQDAKSRDCSNLFVPQPKAVLSGVQGKFNDWLDRALGQPIPCSVIAFSFNLTETWCIEVVGSDRYSDDDPDWACEESFRPDVGGYTLPDSAVGKTWRTVLKEAKRLISAYLHRPSAGSTSLRRAKAVVVGFVDGDLHRVWPE